jgi:hypothetical protein
MDHKLEICPQKSVHVITRTSRETIDQNVHDAFGAQILVAATCGISELRDDGETLPRDRLVRTTESHGELPP